MEQKRIYQIAWGDCPFAALLRFYKLIRGFWIDEVRDRWRQEFLQQPYFPNVFLPLMA
jgi:hypothetical protein